MTKQKKTCQTAVKYTPDIDLRIEKTIRSKGVPRSFIFHSLIEVALDYAEKSSVRLEDVHVHIRSALFKPPEQSKTTMSSSASVPISGTRSTSNPIQEATSPAPNPVQSQASKAGAISYSGVDSAKT